MGLTLFHRKFGSRKQVRIFSSLIGLVWAPLARPCRTLKSEAAETQALGTWLGSCFALPSIPLTFRWTPIHIFLAPNTTHLEDRYSTWMWVVFECELNWCPLNECTECELYLFKGELSWYPLNECTECELYSMDTNSVHSFNGHQFSSPWIQLTFNAWIGVYNTLGVSCIGRWLTFIEYNSHSARIQRNSHSMRKNVMHLALQGAWPSAKFTKAFHWKQTLAFPFSILGVHPRPAKDLAHRGNYPTEESTLACLVQV